METWIYGLGRVGRGGILVRANVTFLRVFTLAREPLGE